jgi:hypothetical protein
MNVSKVSVSLLYPILEFIKPSFWLSGIGPDPSGSFGSSTGSSLSSYK